MIDDIADTETVAEDAAVPSARPAKRKAKANGTAKVKAAKAAKPAVKAAGKVKAAKPAKAKASAKPRKAPEYDPAKLDQFGLRKGSLKSQAAVMYARAGGASLGEVRKSLDSVQFNVLTQLRGKGYIIDEKSEDGKGNRSVTRFFLRTKPKK